MPKKVGDGPSRHLVEHLAEMSRHVKETSDFLYYALANAGFGT